MKMFKCSNTVVVSFAAACLLNFGCQKASDPAPAAVSKAEKTNVEQLVAPLSVEEAQDDLVGNWRLDLSRSRSAGLKEAALANSKITMVMEPDGSRILYRDTQPIEQAELVLRTVEPDGKLIGRFNRSSKGLPLDVKIEVLDENRMQWTFSEGQRTELFVRQQVEASADFKE
jgi:hypothetical protein